MSESYTTTTWQNGRSERGSARAKFLVVISLVSICAYAGFKYVPVAFQAYQFRDLMQESVDKGAALGKPQEWVKEQLVKSGGDYGVPPNATISIEPREGAMIAHVQFKRPISLIGYTYEYNFDYTAKSSSMWSIK